MSRAIWNGEVLAESDQGILVEGGIYFPPDSVKTKYLKRSQTEYTCPWKGQAGYYDISVGGKTLPDGAWFYYQPTDVAKVIKDYVAFDTWSGVRVEGKAASRLDRPY
ncbi:MAG: DUF427 domain-containing protein [Dehalococcoidales bacterium]|nr:DUF427 domain-containing protein [Dehalococcoidales bacterium]